MISGNITLDGFNYGVTDGETRQMVAGNPVGEAVAVKIVWIQDNASGVLVQLPFKPNEFEQFVAVLRSGISGIVVPSQAIPRAGPLQVGRNGR